MVLVKTMKIDTGASLRALMARDKVTLQKLADYLGITTTPVKSMTLKKDMSCSRALEISTYFNITIEEFFEIGQGNG